MCDKQSEPFIKCDHGTAAVRPFKDFAVSLRVRRLKMLFLCKNKNGIFVKEFGTSGYIVAWAIYTSHTYQFIPKHTVFRYSAACLSVLFRYFLAWFRLHPNDMLGKIKTMLMVSRNLIAKIMTVMAVEVLLYMFGMVSMLNADLT